MNDRHSAIAVTCVVVPPIAVTVAVMVSYTDAHATRANADICILSISDAGTTIAIPTATSSPIVNARIWNLLDGLSFEFNKRNQ